MVFCSYQSTDLIPYIHRIFLPYFPQILKPPSWIPYNPHNNALKLVKTKQDWLKVQAELSLCGRHWLSNQQFQGSWVAREKNRNFLHWLTIYSWAFLGLILYGKTQKKKIYRLLHDKFPVLRQRISRNVISHSEKKKQKTTISINCVIPPVHCQKLKGELEPTLQRDVLLLYDLSLDIHELKKAWCFKEVSFIEYHLAFPGVLLPVTCNADNVIQAFQQPQLHTHTHTKPPTTKPPSHCRSLPVEEGMEKNIPHCRTLYFQLWKLFSWEEGYYSVLWQ